MFRKLLFILIIIVLFISGCFNESILFRITVTGRPSYSIDGEKVLFSAIVKDVPGIYSMDLTWKNIKKLSGNDDSFSPAYSYDGKKIAYVGHPKEGKGTEIWSMNADGTNKKEITKAGHLSLDPFFSPDGKRIYFSRALLPLRKHESKRRGFDIYVIDIDGKNEKRIGDGDYYKIYSPICTPDEKYVVFSTVLHKEYHERIVKLDISTGYIDVLTSQKCIIRPTVTNDGTKIIYNKSNFFSEEFKRTPKPVAGFYSMDIDGENKELLFETEEGYILSLTKDDKKLIYLSRDGDRKKDEHKMYEANINGTGLREIEINVEKMLSLN